MNNPKIPDGYRAVRLLQIITGEGAFRAMEIRQVGAPHPHLSIARLTTERYGTEELLLRALAAGEIHWEPWSDLDRS
jgi:hypothetical protein